MTSAVTVPVIPGDFKTATRATGERCTGVGQRPTEYWGDRATCPGCMLNQRMTVDRVMMSHYVTPVNGTPTTPAVPALTVPLTSVTAVSAVSSRFEEVIANLDTPTEPSTVGEFVRAIIALSGALAAAQARITELEQTPVTNESVEQWQADWLELNHLLALYAVQRAWCPEFERIVSGWNRTHFQQGYLLSRDDVGTGRRTFDANHLSQGQQRANVNTLGQRRDAALHRYRAAQ